MTLKDLEPGDIFVHAKSKAKNPQKFVVIGNCLYNQGYGTSTRLCKNIGKQETESKSCRLEVKKTGESIHKQKLLNK